MTKRRKPPEDDILEKQIWELTGRWQTRNIHLTAVRQKNLTNWAFHSLPPLITHDLSSTEWITETKSYQEALSKLRLLIAQLEKRYLDRTESDYRKASREAMARIAALEAYLQAFTTPTEDSENR